MNRLILRPALLEESEAISQFDKSVWGDDGVSADCMKCRISTFPDGNLIALKEGKIVSYVCFQRINVPNIDIFSTWDSITDNGTLAGSHDPKGKHLFMVNSTSSTDAPKNAYTLLLGKVAEYCFIHGIKKAYSGIRMPGYSTFKSQNPGIQNFQYIKLKDERGKYIDPMLKFFAGFGANIIKVLPNYFPDEASLNNGVLICIKNEFHWLPFKKFFYTAFGKWAMYKNHNLRA